jgi:hypothetical protein
MGHDATMSNQQRHIRPQAGRTLRSSPVCWELGLQMEKLRR